MQTDSTPRPAHPIRRLLRWALVGLAVLVATTVAAGIWLWNDPARAYRLAMVAGHANAGVVERFVEIDGHRWRVLDTDPPEGAAREDAASADGPANTVLVLHGLGTSAEAMMGVAQILRDRSRVVVPDLPGFGEHAMHGDLPHDWRFYVDSIERFRAHEGLGTVDVVGTSMGGAFAAAYAATYPESVRRVVLLSPAGVKAPVENPFMKRVAAGEIPLDIKDDASFEEVLRLNFPSPPPMPAPIRAAFVERAIERREALLGIIEDLRPFLIDGCSGLMPRVKAPTLVLYGSLDQLTDPSMLSVWRLGLPNMEGEVLEGAGHVLLYDKPAEVAKKMRAHLARDAAS
jgi:pimeloyl-ACP methyl ester carboxylesterase